MTSLMDKCAVTGVGETAYSKNSGKSVVALQMEASLKAIADAGLKPTDIDGVIPYGNLDVVAEEFITNLGFQDLRFSATTPLGGASCVAAIQAAVSALGACLAKHLLSLIGGNGCSVERISSRSAVLP